MDVLRRPPRVPSDPELFTSGTLFGQPGIYPQGAPMVPAGAPGPGDEVIRRDLERVVGTAGLPLLDDDRLVEAVPDERLRVALVALHGTLAAPVGAAFPAGTTAARLIFGRPSSPGRVVGPAGPAETDEHARVVNERYRYEHPLLLCGSLVHDLLWTPATVGHAAEVVLHALLAMVHVQVLARVPDLARAGTELSRRQNSLAITWLNSRGPGAVRSSLVAPDGPGTVPGGDPAMQTPDFWSIPFAAEREEPAPPLLGAVLATIVDRDAALPALLRFGPALVAWIDEHLREDWLAPDDHARVLVALGMLDPAELAEAAGLSRRAVCDVLGVEG